MLLQHAPGGTLTAVVGLGSIAYTGGSVAAGAACTFQVDVTATVSGTLVNTSGDLTSSSGNSGTASDTLTVGEPAEPTLTKAFIPNLIVPGGTTVLEFTITNNEMLGTISGIQFIDNFTQVLPGLVATGLPLNDVCGAGSSISGTDVLTFVDGVLPPSGSCTFSVTVQSSVFSLQNTYTNIVKVLDTTQHPASINVDAMANLTIGGDVLLQDSDGDGISDFNEDLLGLDPNNPDSDGNGTPDSAEDNDGDNVTNRNEILLGFDPTDPNSTPIASYSDVDGFHPYFAEIEILTSLGHVSACEDDRFCPNEVILRDRTAMWVSSVYNQFLDQLPPDIATGTVFDDVMAGDFAAAFIEDLHNNGIIMGCIGTFGSPGFRYCPRGVLLKSVSAKIVLTAHAIATGFAIPIALTSPYSDVSVGPPADFAANEIIELFNRGHGGGCDGDGITPATRYCPNEVFTRAGFTNPLVWVFGLRPNYSSYDE